VLKKLGVVVVVCLVTGFLTAKITSDYAYDKTKDVSQSESCRNSDTCYTYTQGSVGFPFGVTELKTCLNNTNCETRTNSSITTILVINSLIWALPYLIVSYINIFAVSRVKSANSRD
jgi:hypothetical protein